MAGSVPESGPSFEAMMREIDAALAKERVPIPGRPFRAIRVISRRYKISLLLTSAAPGTPPELLRYAKLSENIHRWYELTYGERLKVDPSPGRMVIRIDGDLYVLSVPRIFGAVEFVVSRQFIDFPVVGVQSPPVCNIIQLVDDLTPSKAATLSDTSLACLQRDFGLAIHVHYALEASQGSELIRIARSDIEAAVNSLMARNQYGASKWASLQAAEKILKAALDLEGRKYPRTHLIADLSRLLGAAGIQFNSSPFVEAIQCTPSIRYGQEVCTADEALAAHHASLHLVIELIRAGAKIKKEIDGD